jgi:hypothetical protein
VAAILNKDGPSRCRKPVGRFCPNNGIPDHGLFPGQLCRRALSVVLLTRGSHYLQRRRRASTTLLHSPVSKNSNGQNKILTH